MMVIILLALACFTLLGLMAFAYYGAFASLNIRIEEQGGETVVCRSITGDYRQSGMIMDKIYYTLLNDYNVETFKGYAKYFDNPRNVERNKLRSEAGCIVEPADADRLALAATDFMTKQLPVDHYIVAEFPYKGKLSVLFGLVKVYPALRRFADQNGCGDAPVVDIYDIPNKRIFYRKEIIVE
ncbi:MAG: hypothetical protein QM786_14850 [Breznakibacter sp.]